MYKSTISRIGLKFDKTEFKKEKITCSKSAADYARQFYFDDLFIYESVFIILLNSINNTIGYAKISQGGVGGSVVDVRIVAKYAIETLCHSVILVHNHPSGGIRPSDADEKITRQTIQALKLFGIQLVDHVIITEKEYFSFADEGLLI